jgi:hypothetical protein
LSRLERNRPAWRQLRRRSGRQNPSGHPRLQFRRRARHIFVRTGRKIGWEHAKVGDDTTLTYRFANTGSDDETVEPRVEPFRIAESGQITPGDHQRVLYGILGSVDIAEDPLRDREEPVAPDADQIDIRLPIPVPGRLHEVAIHGSRLPMAARGGRRLTLLVVCHVPSFILRGRRPGLDANAYQGVP